jgi:hypothetical protein
MMACPPHTELGTGEDQESRNCWLSRHPWTSDQTTHTDHSDVIRLILRLHMSRGKRTKPDGTSGWRRKGRGKCAGEVER